jgi:hypothetical protein
MRIAQIAPLHEAVPPKLYRGTERVVSLTEELVALGHQVTLFASGDSVTSARLHAVWSRSLRLDPAMRDVIAPHMRHAPLFHHDSVDYRLRFGHPAGQETLNPQMANFLDQAGGLWMSRYASAPMAAEIIIRSEGGYSLRHQA